MRYDLTKDVSTQIAEFPDKLGKPHGLSAVWKTKKKLNASMHALEGIRRCVDECIMKS